MIDLITDKELSETLFLDFKKFSENRDIGVYNGRSIIHDDSLLKSYLLNNEEIIVVSAQTSNKDYIHFVTDNILSGCLKLHNNWIKFSWFEVKREDYFTNERRNKS